jgi:hypothetical protein
MTKRISRKALALAAIGAIAAPAFATVANAQIITKTIAVTLKAVGPVPSGVTGANVTVTCKNTTNNPGETVSAFSLTPGQTANLNNFLLTATAPGSSCKVKVVNAGSANTTLGATIVSIGGATATSGAGGVAGIGYKAGSGGTVETDFVPVTDSTDVQITMSFPQITVKKVVVGDEATAGFAYPMSIACSNPADARFISPANGLEGGNVTIATSTSTAATRIFRAAQDGQNRSLTMFFAGGSRTVNYFNAGSASAALPASIVAAIITSDTVSGTVPAAYTVGTVVGGVAGAYNSAVNTSDVAVGSYTGTLVPGSTTSYIAAGNIIIPGANYFMVQFFGPGNAANNNTPILLGAVPIFNYANAGPYPTIAAISMPAAGTAPAYFVNSNPAVAATLATATFATAAATNQGTNGVISGITVPAGSIWTLPATTTGGSTLTPGAAVGAVNQYVNALLLNAPDLTAATGPTAGSVIVYPYNYTGVVAAGGIIGNWANLGTGNPSLYTQVLNQILSEKIGGAIAPNTAGGFTGSFALKGGESKSLSFNEFPGLTTASKCEVWETNGGGATATGFSSTNGTAAPLGGVNNSAGRWQSNLTAMNETITVTNSFYGDMIISKVVTGDPKTNVATYEISVACDKGGPKDTFLIKDRQSKVYSNIASGTNCLITETKSDGAVASYKDNSGDNTTDGRVTIKRRPVGGCGDVLGVTGAPTAATPGGPAPTTTFNECWASIIITNDYNPPATTEAPKAAAAVAPATAAPATAAPAVAPAPAVAVDATPTFAG